MSKRSRTGWMNVDWMTLSLYISLLAVGWLMIFAVGYKPENYSSITNYVLSFRTPIGKQTIWVFLSILLLIVLFVIDSKFWKNFSYPIYLFTLLLLILVLFAGTEIKGARSWFTFMGFTFQPSEFAKFGTALVLANYLSSFNTDFRRFRTIAFAAAFCLVPMLLILAQPDAGSALVFLSFMIVMYRAGLSPGFFHLLFSGIALGITSLIFGPLWVIFTLLCLAILLLSFQMLQNRPRALGLSLLLIGGAGVILYFQSLLWAIGFLGAVFLLSWGIFFFGKKAAAFNLAGVLLIIASSFCLSTDYAFEHGLQAHQQDRINVWLRPHLSDPQGARYNVILSKMAIGSGGLEGKGFLQGTLTKLNYVPEQATDFIFCTVGEEQGFIGTFAVILLFMIFLYRLITLAERQNTEFYRYYGYGVASIFFIHIVINIGMTMGLMPVIGIPLPFLSRGGSSLIGFTLLIGVLLKIDSMRHAV